MEIIKEIDMFIMNALFKMFIDQSNKDVFLICDKDKCWNPSKPQTRFGGCVWNIKLCSLELISYMAFC